MNNISLIVNAHRRRGAEATTCQARRGYVKYAAPPSLRFVSARRRDGRAPSPACTTTTASMATRTGHRHRQQLRRRPRAGRAPAAAAPRGRRAAESETGPQARRRPAPAPPPRKSDHPRKRRRTSGSRRRAACKCRSTRRRTLRAPVLGDGVGLRAIDDATVARNCVDAIDDAEPSCLRRSYAVLFEPERAAQITKRKDFWPDESIFRSAVASYRDPEMRWRVGAFGAPRTRTAFFRHLPAE